MQILIQLVPTYIKYMHSKFYFYLEDIENKKHVKLSNSSIFVVDFLFTLHSTLQVQPITKSLPFDETHLDAVRGLIELRGFHPSASTSGARRSDADTSDKDKQICFMLMPKT